MSPHLGSSASAAVAIKRRSETIPIIFFMVYPLEDEDPPAATLVLADGHLVRHPCDGELDVDGSVRAEVGEDDDVVTGGVGQSGAPTRPLQRAAVPGLVTNTAPRGVESLQNREVIRHTSLRGGFQE